MILRLTTDEAKELRSALSAAHREVLRDLSSVAGCGFSPGAMELCRRRSRIEELLAHLDLPVAAVMAPETVEHKEHLEAAA